MSHKYSSHVWAFGVYQRRHRMKCRPTTTKERKVWKKFRDESILVHRCKIGKILWK